MKNVDIEINRDIHIEAVYRIQFEITTKNNNKILK